jgi:molybdopterin/thiamine biosynthesis adenylyltransferase
LAAAGAELSPQELLRYDRQLSILGLEGQRKLKALSVLVAGAGGLGSFEMLYLAAAGVGKIIVVDGDTVDRTNLNRQVLHWEEDLGRPKAVSAAEKIRRFNPNVVVEPVTEPITRDNVDELVSRADVVVDGLDNWEARFILDEAAYRQGKPFIHAGVHGLEGQVVPVVPGETSCLRCLLPESLSSPPKVPAIAFAVGIVAGVAVAELVKLVTGIGETNKGRMLIIDTATMEIMRIELRPRPGCTCPEPAAGRIG